jgi:hypothetical protein
VDIEEPFSFLEFRRESWAAGVTKIQIPREVPIRAADIAERPARLDGLRAAPSDRVSRRTSLRSRSL